LRGKEEKGGREEEKKGERGGEKAGERKRATGYRGRKRIQRAP